MDCYCNISDIITVGDEINVNYHRLVNTVFLMGSVVLITTITNMSLLCNIRKKLYDINRHFMPPLYKVSN